jgi:hypothetical protein
MSDLSVSAEAPPPPIVPEISNSASGANGADVIFISDKASDNQIALLISSNGDAISLSQGTLPIPGPSDPPMAGSTFYADLSALEIAQTVWDSMTFTCPGWAIAHFPNSIVGMTPTQSNVVIGAGSASASISIAGLVLPDTLPPGSAQYSLQYYNVPQLDDAAVYATVFVQRSPTAGNGNLSDYLAMSLSLNTTQEARQEDSSLASDALGILNSRWSGPEIPNAFSLLFYAADGKAVVKAGPDTQFKVQFIYAGDSHGFGALTDVAHAKNMQIDNASPGSSWPGPTGYPDATSPYWTLNPPDGAAIVDGMTTLEWSVANVVTDLEPGPTIMVVSWAKVPTYNDGAIAMPLYKIAHVDVTGLVVVPNDPQLSLDGTAEVVVSWSPSPYAKQLDLSQNGIAQSVLGLTTTPAVVTTETTNFTLAATGTQGTAAAVANVATQSVVANAAPPKPVVHEFSGWIEKKAGRRVVHLRWTTEPASTIVSVSGEDQTFASSVADYSPKDGAPQRNTYTLTATYNNETVTSTIVVSWTLAASKSIARATTIDISPDGGSVFIGGGYRLAKLDALSLVQVYGNDADLPDPIGICVSPNGELIALVCLSPLSPEIAFLDPSTLEPGSGLDRTTLPAGSRDSFAMCFSPDGTRLYTIYGDSEPYTTVTLRTFAAPSWSLLGSSSVTLPQGTDLPDGAWPHQIAVSPDGDVFVSASIQVASLSADGLQIVSRVDIMTDCLVASQSRIYANDETGDIWLLDAASLANEPNSPLRLPYQIAQLVLSNDASTLFVVSSAGIKIFDPAAVSEVPNMPPIVPPGYSFSDQSRLAVSADCTVFTVLYFDDSNTSFVATFSATISGGVPLPASRA